MHLLKTARLIFTFYKSFFLATSLITIVCVNLFWKYGISTFTVLLWFKVATLILVYFFIRSAKGKELYYYQNLGVSKAVLWTSVLTLDFLIFIFSMLLTHNYR